MMNSWMRQFARPAIDAELRVNRELAVTH